MSTIPCFRGKAPILRYNLFQCVNGVWCVCPFLSKCSIYWGQRDRELCVWYGCVFPMPSQFRGAAPKTHSWPCIKPNCYSTVFYSSFFFTCQLKWNHSEQEPLLSLSVRKNHNLVLLWCSASHLHSADLLMSDCIPGTSVELHRKSRIWHLGFIYIRAQRFSGA